MNDHITPIPGLGQTTAEAFLAEYNFLQRELGRVQEELRQVTHQRDVYANTCRDHAEKIERLETALRRVNRYGSTLNTRLDSIDEAIAAARKAATEFAYNEEMTGVVRRTPIDLDKAKAQISGQNDESPAPWRTTLEESLHK